MNSLLTPDESVSGPSQLWLEVVLSLDEGLCTRRPSHWTEWSSSISVTDAHGRAPLHTLSLQSPNLCNLLTNTRNRLENISHTQSIHSTSCALAHSKHCRSHPRPTTALVSSSDTSSASCEAVSNICVSIQSQSHSLIYSLTLQINALVFPVSSPSTLISG